MAAPVRTPEKLASRQSPCPLCADPICKGDPIKLPAPALGWMHASCADDYLEVYPPDDFDEEASGG